MSKKKIIIDLRTSGHFGVSCKCFELLESFKQDGKKVELIMNNWGHINTARGLTFNSVVNSYDKGSSKYLWDPKVHPTDTYENLIVPSFNNINLISQANFSLLEKIRIFIPPFLSPNRFVYYDFTTKFMETSEFNKSLKQKKKELFLDHPNIKHLIRYLLFIFYVKIFRYFKINVKSLGFRFQLSSSMFNDNVKNFIYKHKNNKIKYILLSVTWDEKMKFEVQNDRVRGGPVPNDTEFNNLLDYVKKLDDFALKTKKIKFILASKKAVDWDKFIKSEFLDMRNFEELGFTLSQTIFILQELSDVTLNWPSTFSIWITNCKNIIHLTWHDNKDTAKWTRNELHKQPINILLNKLNLT